MKKFRLPAALSDQDLEQHFTQEEIRGIEFLYDYIISHDIVKKDSAEFAYDYVQISRDILRSFLGIKSYNDILNQLIHLGYLERLGCDENGWAGPDDIYEREGFYRQPPLEGEVIDEDYPPRRKSFRIPAAIRQGERSYRVIAREISKVEANKIEAAKTECSHYQEKYRDIIRRNMENLALVDTEACRQTITQYCSYEGLQTNPTEFIDLFNDSSFHDTGVDAFGHRVNAILTRTHRALRPYVRFKHELETPLVEIDFVASQPSLLACITPRLIARLAPECKAAAPLFKAIQNETGWQQYRALCLNTQPGRGIYDVLAQYYTNLWAVPMDRNNGKEIYYRACFSNYAWFAKRSLKQLEDAHRYQLTNGNEKARQRSADKVFTKRCILLFEKNFPCVYALFWKLKELDWQVEGRTKPHANNCLLAQRIESSLMYTVLVKAVREKGVLDVVTIHDALFVKVTDESKVRQVVEKELVKLNLNLKLKSK